MSVTLKDKILKALLDTQKIKKEDIDEAVALQKQKGVSFERALIEKNLIQEKDLLLMLVRELNIPFINLSKYRIDPHLKEIVPERISRLYQIVPISLLDYTLTVAISDPLNVFVIDDLKNITGKEVDIVISTASEITKAIDRFYGTEKVASVQDITKDLETENFEIVSNQDEEDNVDSVIDESEKAPIIRIVNLVLKEAIKQRASDIHLEPMQDGTRVRYRVDGVLQEIINIPKDSQNAVVVRIKIMSRLDITTVHIPQDGRFKLKIGGKEVDFRVSILPTTFGQKVVMRILDKGNLSAGVRGLGLSAGAVQVLEEAIKKPFGMILVTGPTGSGKSTTLYSLISALNSVDRNIITVEDPVEYLVEGLTQIQARPEIGLTFAEGLRSILRQSPDIVMVGEIRDSETADIAIKASLTGQLVFSTLHTNDSAGAVTRLVDMGVESFLVASSLVLVTAQRLCRKICTQCKAPIDIPKKVLEKIPFKFKPGTVFYEGKGCENCRKSGYRGRTGITEILVIDDSIRIMLMEGKSSDDIKEYARKSQGMKTLFEDAVDKFIEGITTLEEVLRVTSGD
jgi:type IV pilus assembly protein PilB